MRRSSTLNPGTPGSIRSRALAALAILTATLVVLPVTAGADTSQGGSASAYGLELAPIIPPTPAQSSTLADEDADATETLVEIPAAPLAVSGTATATAAVHKESDLASNLVVNSQGVEGPYNAVAFGEIEGADVLVDVIDVGVSLVTADAVRAEAVAVCVGDVVTYSANSEIVNLDIAGQDLPLNSPLSDILDAVSDLLEQTTLNQIVSVERNVVTESANGIAVDALRVNVLDVADTPISVVLGHAELSDVTCGPDATTPQCSDGADNDDDGFTDAADPNCHTDGNPYNPDSYDPTDDDESGAIPECVDGVDNDDDQVSDQDDPGCHTDGDATNPASFDPSDDSEAETALPRTDDAPLPRTGGDVPLAGAMALGLAGLGALHLMRRRSIV